MLFWLGTSNYCQVPTHVQNLLFRLKSSSSLRVLLLVRIFESRQFWKNFFGRGFFCKYFENFLLIAFLCFESWIKFFDFFSFFFFFWHQFALIAIKILDRAMSTQLHVSIFKNTVYRPFFPDSFKVEAPSYGCICVEFSRTIFEYFLCYF